MKIKGVIEDLKIKKIKKTMIVKIYLGLSLVFWTVWGQFIFRQFLDLAYISQRLQALPMQLVLMQSFILLHLSLPKQFPLFILASSVCWPLHWSLFQAHLFSPAVGREEHCKQISLACVGSTHSVSATLGLTLLTVCVLSQSTLFSLQVPLLGTV